MPEIIADIPSFERLKERADAARAYLHIDEAATEAASLEDAVSQPTFWDDVDTARATTKRLSALKNLLASYDEAKRLLDDISTAYELAADDVQFQHEAERLSMQLDARLQNLEIRSWFSGDLDGNDAIVSINPGQGGLEAQDWTDMLYRMYKRYADSKGWSVRDLDVVVGEGIGLDRAIIQIEGENAYGMLRSEHGIHRLVRISPTDIKGRRQTTFAAVDVMPLVTDEIVIDVNPSDVRVDVYRSSGPGGQCVNTTDSAVRLTHVPTGIVVTCQNEKSQLQNKEAAFRVLRSRLYERERALQDERMQEIRGERMDNSFGSQIRNYTLYPFQLVKDVRSGVETSNAEAVLDGDIDAFVIGYHRWKASQ